MLSALRNIVSGVMTIVDVITSFFTGLIQLFSLIGSSFAFIGQMWLVIPPVLVVFGSAGVGVIIVLHMIGR